MPENNKNRNINSILNGTWNPDGQDTCIPGHEQSPPAPPAQQVPVNSAPPQVANDASQPPAAAIKPDTQPEPSDENMPEETQLASEQDMQQQRKPLTKQQIKSLQAKSKTKNKKQKKTAQPGRLDGISDKLCKKALGSDWKNVSPKQKMNLVAMPVLMVIFVFVALKMFNVSGPKKAVAQVGKPVTASKTVEKITNWKLPEPYPAELPDPMTGKSSLTSGGSAIVTGIIYSQDNPLAIIDGQIVKEGQEILGVRILKITPDTVEFASKGKTWKQKLNDE